MLVDTVLRATTRGTTTSLMPEANVTKMDFAGGALSPKVAGRGDLGIYRSGAEVLKNFIIEEQGPMSFRTGTRYVHHTRLNRDAVFIPFQFNDEQSYIIEATELVFRFYRNEGIILETAKNITAITQANPAVVTSASHGYSNGAEVFISGVSGMTEVNGKYFIVAGVTTNTFQLTDVDGNNINSTGFTAYSTGGTVEKVYELTSPYTLAQAKELQYAQNADTMYLTHEDVEPKYLTRTGHTSWTIAAQVRTADPFSAPNYPRAVTFTDDGRLMFGFTPNKPETFWASRSPNAGAARFGDFTTGTDDSHAVIFTLAPIHGKVDAIQWLSNTDKFIVAGAFGTIRRIYGASQSEPISPTSISAKSVNAFGAARILPVTNGTNLFYVERGRKKLRSIEYDYVSDGYVSTNRNLVAEHVVEQGIKQIVNQSSDPDVLWIVRDDGALVGLTYNDKENKSGFHEHEIAGDDAKVLWAGVMPRPDAQEQLWLIVERTVDGATRRYVEFMEDFVVFPQRHNFRTSQASKTTDTEKFLNALYEKQKQAVHVDCASTYDGSTAGSDASATITPAAGATTLGSTGVVFTSSAAVFSADMVGRQIWKKYDDDGNGGGRAEITAYNSTTEVECTILKAFNDANDMVPGGWFLTATTVNGLDYLEGQTVRVVRDGALESDKVVTNGQITLTTPGSVITVGLGYTGIFKSVNLEVGGVTGSALSKYRNVYKVVASLLNAAGLKVGTDLYNLEKPYFTTFSDIANRPAPLATENKEITIPDTSAREKHVYVIQDAPFPCTVRYLDVFTATADE